MFLKELVGERVTIELSKEELVKLRILLGKLKRLSECKGQPPLSEDQLFLIWQLGTFKDIATRGMVDSLNVRSFNTMFGTKGKFTDNKENLESVKHQAIV